MRRVARAGALLAIHLMPEPQASHLAACTLAAQPTCTRATHHSLYEP